MTVPITPRPEPPKPEDVQAQYGFVALLARQIPELSAVLQRATGEKWTAERFSMEVANTNWWKTTPNGQRQWITQQIADPATAAKTIEVGANSILQRAIEMGVSLTPDQAREVWVQSKILGDLDEKNLVGIIYAKANPSADSLTQAGGKLGQITNEMLKLANDYGYRASNVMDEVNSHAREIMFGGGAGTTEKWRSKMINYAMRKYAPYAEQIRGGETIADIAQPYRDSYRKILETNDVSMFDPLIDRALQGVNTDKGPVGQTVWEFEKGLRQDPRWGYTQNARETAAQTATAIGKAFGMIG